jgi:hypothetical protein
MGGKTDLIDRYDPATMKVVIMFRQILHLDHCVAWPGESLSSRFIRTHRFPRLITTGLQVALANVASRDFSEFAEQIVGYFDSREPVAAQNSLNARSLRSAFQGNVTLCGAK